MYEEEEEEYVLQSLVDDTSLKFESPDIHGSMTKSIKSIGKPFFSGAVNEIERETKIRVSKTVSFVPQLDSKAGANDAKSVKMTQLVPEPENPPSMETRENLLSKVNKLRRSTLDIS